MWKPLLGVRFRKLAASGEEQHVANERSPDAWVGQQVALRYWYGDGRNTLKCTLEDVGDRGVVVRFTERGKQRTRFFPWSAVLHIEPRAGGEPSGG